MLKTVSVLNGSSVRQSVTTLGIELQLQLKKILFKKKNIFRRRRPMEDDLANKFTSLHFPDACVTSI